MDKEMDGKSLDITAEKVNRLRELFPEVFAEDKIDFKRLRDVLGDDVVFQNEHYELSWAGKSAARREVQKQTTATLVPDKEGSINFDNTENIFIEGENLEVLRVLQKSYFGKVKMIYIDPPYNTGNDSFVYPDDYTERADEYKRRTGQTDEEGYLNKQDLWKKNSRENGQFHSVWLSMMYPRLYCAYNLLDPEQGLIFVSIDDNEAANLKLLLDEIFGESNFISSITVQVNKGGRDYLPIAVSHETLFCYSRSNFTEVNELPKEVNFQLTDAKGGFEPRELRNRNPKFNRGNRPNLYYPVYVDPQSADENGFCLVSLKMSEKFSVETFPLNSKGEDSCWRWGKPKFMDNNDEKEIDKSNLFGKQKSDGGWNIYEKSRKSTQKAKSIWDETEVRTEKGTKDLRAVFGAAYFDHPKPTDLIKKCIQLGANEDSLVLDFFAGSCTTAQAVLDLNEEDGGSRKFICIQMPELLDEGSEAAKAGYKTIADISKARIQKVIEKISAERNGKLDLEKAQQLGFQSYTLAPSNFNQWRGDVEGAEIIKQLELHQQAEKQDSPQLNMLYELLLKGGKPLTAKVEEITIAENCKVFNVDNGNVWMLFDKYIPQVKGKVTEAKPQQLVCLNSCFATDQDLSNLKLELNEAGIKLTIV